MAFLKQKFVYRIGIFGAFLFLMPLSNCTFKKAFEPNWESINSRKTPQWWIDAKFGIFIHWGLYSVPSYSPVGTYAEWYWNRINKDNKSMQLKGDFRIPDSDQVKAFHENRYGANFPYSEFASQFKAELFQPKHWADVFKRSGAKYVVLGSKHHDGFALWPSEEAKRSWGKAWNALDTGPKRDVLGDLTEAVRDAGLEMGFYYSLYEWYNPLYRSDFSRYVDEHMHPQFKDLVSRYRPSVIFADGEWLHSSKAWKAEQLLAWLFNESPVADKVVINDRWGKETRHKHGGYYTTEYGAGLPNAAHPWEESRGMGTSYGFNRSETLKDYSSSQRLILTLVDTVSRGGNLLLNVGPTADGRIPVIMEDRLNRIGNWLRVNGEAIYGTSPYKKPVQWSSGRQLSTIVSTHGFSDYDIIEQVFSPKPGDARKELFFTMKEGVLYAISPYLPKEFIFINDLTLSKKSKITLLGIEDSNLKWEQIDDNVKVFIPYIYPQDLSFREAFVFRIDKWN